MSKQWKLPSVAKLAGEAPETMWACGTANLPNHGDTVIDRNGHEWKFYSETRGWVLRSKEKGAHTYINGVDWCTLAGWFNEG